jgi:hypothetical protein
MPIVEPNVIRCAFKFRQGTDERVMVTHWQDQNPPVTSQDLIDLGAQMEEWWDNVGKQCSHVSLCLTDITLTDLTTETGAVHTHLVSPQICGAYGGGSAASGHTTSTVSWRTAARGPQGRGRNYWPGLSDDATNDDSTITSTMVLRLAVAAANLVFGYNPPSIFIGVLSRVHSIFRLANDIVIENVIDSQRRRLPKRGR